MGHIFYFSHEYENQQELERKSSFSSEFDGQSSISESEASTAPSSLQTIVRSPYKSQQGNIVGNQSNPTSSNHQTNAISNGHHSVNLAGGNSLSSECSDLSPPSTPIPPPFHPPFSSIPTLSPNTSNSSSMIPTRRTSQNSASGNPNSQIPGTKKLERGDEHSDLDSVQNHAHNLRKVSEQLLSNPRTRQSFTGGNAALPASGLPASTSRPGSIARYI